MEALKQALSVRHEAAIAAAISLAVASSKPNLAERLRSLAFDLTNQAGVMVEQGEIDDQPRSSMSAATQPAQALYPPGPWEAHGCTVYEADKWRKGGRNDGGCFVACTVDPEFLEMPTDEMHARAVALAALPELLQACKVALEYLESPPFIELHGDQPAKQARAAIAKAEGVI